MYWIASIWSHIALGMLLAIFFILYYVNGDGKWKIFLEVMIGIGGNIGGIFILDNFFQLNIDEFEEIENIGVIRICSIACCLTSFIISSIVFLIILSFVIRGRENRNFISLRDIILGKRAWIDAYYKKKTEEIDRDLNITMLEQREKEITRKEELLNAKEHSILEEEEKLNQMSKKKLKIFLPENGSVALTNEYIEAMPSYINDVVACINNITSCTKIILEKKSSEINITTLKSYFISIATFVSNDIFGGNAHDIRIHFRIYDEGLNGYKKLVAVKGKDIVKKDLTFIPLNGDNMIKKSYECRRALIKSINLEHDYKSNNYAVWEDYMTYAFYDLEYNGIPFLSFGISIKNSTRYKKILHLLNFFKIEDFLQNNIEKINDYVNIANLFYGG